MIDQVRIRTRAQFNPSHLPTFSVGLARTVHLTQHSERTGREQNWFSLTGRVVAVKVEADGDLHIELSDATGDKQGIVVVEIPLGPQWCNIRTTVFSWSPTRFPFQTRSTKKLKVIKPPMIKSFDRQLFRPGPAQCSAPLRGASLDL